MDKLELNMTSEYLINLIESYGLSFDEEILVECIDSKFKEKINIEIVSLKRINNLIWKLKELKVINKFNFKSKFTDKNYIDIVCNNNSDPIFWIEIDENNFEKDGNQSSFTVVKKEYDIYNEYGNILDYNYIFKKQSSDVNKSEWTLTLKNYYYSIPTSLKPVKKMIIKINELFKSEKISFNYDNFSFQIGLSNINNNRNDSKSNLTIRYYLDNLLDQIDIWDRLILFKSDEELTKKYLNYKLEILHPFMVYYEQLKNIFDNTKKCSLNGNFRKFSKYMLSSPIIDKKYFLDDNHFDHNIVFLESNISTSPSTPAFKGNSLIIFHIALN